MIKVYGIKNCDTVKKSLKWLDEQGAQYEFIDFKKAPPTAALLNEWCQTLDWETLLNKRGTTWRKLEEADKKDLNKEKALALLIEHPSMIKRPIMDFNHQITCGFTPERWEALINP